MRKVLLQVETEKTVNRRFLIPLTAILLAVILILAFAVGYLVSKDKGFFDVTSIFKSENENTILLNEFVVNINSNNDRRGYLKVEMALMYNDKKDGEVIETNINKIRDIIINNLMYKSSDDILNVESLKKS